MSFNTCCSPLCLVGSGAGSVSWEGRTAEPGDASVGPGIRSKNNSVNMYSLLNVFLH